MNDQYQSITPQSKTQCPDHSTEAILQKIRFLAKQWEESVTRAEKACDIALRQIEAFKLPTNPKM